jgi:ammonia channel protein AmtB
MALASFLLMLLGSVGMTVIIVEGAIFVPVKEFLKKIIPEYVMKVLDCHQCCGFWSGLFLSLFFLTPEWRGDIMSLLLQLGLNFANGCATSLLAVFWATIMVFIESKTTLNQ